MISEKQLIENCQNGDKKSQYLLVKRYASMLLSICRRYSRDNAMAQDLLQETLINIFKGIPNYKPTGSFEGWMKRIAVNCSLAWIKKSSYKNEYPTIDFEDPVQQPTVFSELAQEEIIEQIQSLPDQLRTVLNLFIVEGYRHAEIAKMLNIPENSSRSYLMRGRKLLVEKLKDYRKKMSA